MVNSTAAPGLQRFLEDYASEYPEEVLRIESPVDARFEVTAIVRKLEREKRFPVLVFQDVRTDGRRSDFPLVAFLMSSRQRLARLLRAPIGEAGLAVHDRMQHPLRPQLVSRVEAPVKEITWHGSEVDVTRLPAIWHHEQDPGRYITGGFLTCQNPETGIENSALQRGWLASPREIPLLIGAHSHNYAIWQQYRQRQQDMPIAYWVGHHPLAILGCQIRVSSTESHYAMAGAMMGAPLRVVPSDTLGDDFLVPADAEFIIEGHVPWNEFRPEGPFGEYTRHVGEAHEEAPFIRVAAVTHRRNAHWYDLMIGYTHWLSSLPIEGLLYHNLKRQFPQLVGVHMPMSGTGVQHAYLQVRKTREGQGKAIATAALGMAPPVDLKHVFVVDEDIDILEDKEVLLAMATRFQGDRDMIQIANTVSAGLDPSAHAGLGTKLAFDCTRPMDDFPERLRIPDAVESDLDLDRFIPKERRDEIPLERYG
jgi:2,5-furandicarboxylate decarboxylase 1